MCKQIRFYILNHVSQWWWDANWLLGDRVVDTPPTLRQGHKATIGGALSLPAVTRRTFGPQRFLSWTLRFWWVIWTEPELNLVFVSGGGMKPDWSGCSAGGTHRWRGSLDLRQPGSEIRTDMDLLALEMAAMKPDPIPEQNLFRGGEMMKLHDPQPNQDRIRTLVSFSLFLYARKTFVGENVDQIQTKEGSGNKMKVHICSKKTVLFRCEQEPWFCSGIRFGSGNIEGEPVSAAV